MTGKSSLKRIAVSGEFTIFNAAAIRTQLIDALGAASEVEVDLTQVTEVDSTGVQLMVSAKREAAAQEKTLRFTGHSLSVLDALDLTDLAGYLGDPVLLQSRA